VTSQINKDKPVLIAKSSIKGIKVESNTVMTDQTPPTLDLTKTKILVNQPVGSKDKVVMVEAYLSPDTVSAEVKFQDIVINLTQDQAIAEKWAGTTIIPDDEAEQIFSLVVLAVITARDQAGNTLNSDINWSNYEEIQPSLVKQYLFIKNSQSSNIKALLNAGRIYFTILLVISIIALFLNIFIEIRKQHPHLIASTLGLITLLVFLLII
jgi:hypothetical protein